MSDFERSYSLRWSDLDPNLHVRHTSYADLCASVRFDYLESQGFGLAKMATIGVGPVIFKETMSYLSEVLPGDSVTVNFKIAGLSQEGHKWRIFHEVRRESDAKVAATLIVEGAWMNLRERKVSPPPKDLRDLIEALQRTEDFAPL